MLLIGWCGRFPRENWGLRFTQSFYLKLMKLGIYISLLAPYCVGELKQLACGECSRTVQSLTQNNYT